MEAEMNEMKRKLLQMLEERIASEDVEIKRLRGDEGEQVDGPAEDGPLLPEDEDREDRRELRQLLESPDENESVRFSAADEAMQVEIAKKMDPIAFMQLQASSKPWNEIVAKQSDFQFKVPTGELYFRLGMNEDNEPTGGIFLTYKQPEGPDVEIESRNTDFAEMYHEAMAMKYFKVKRLAVIASSLNNDFLNQVRRFVQDSKIKARDLLYMAPNVELMMEVARLAEIANLRCLPEPGSSLAPYIPQEKFHTAYINHLDLDQLKYLIERPYSIANDLTIHTKLNMSQNDAEAALRAFIMPLTTEEASYFQIFSWNEINIPIRWIKNIVDVNRDEELNSRIDFIREYRQADRWIKEMVRNDGVCLQILCKWEDDDEETAEYLEVSQGLIVEDGKFMQFCPTCFWEDLNNPV